MIGEALAHAALRLVGTPFRFHGRDPATGLDCVGVLAEALKSIGHRAPLPSAYSLRNRSVDHVDAIAAACGFAGANGPTEPGDVLFVRIASLQFHMMIALDTRRIVHAHAGLRRVVIGAHPDLPQIVRHWRFQDED